MIYGYGKSYININRLAVYDVREADGSIHQELATGMNYERETDRTLFAMTFEDMEGKPSLKQQINSDGNLPRGIALSPDKKYLFSGNMVSGDITKFLVHEDGTLEYTGDKIKAVSPSAIRFFTAE